MNFDDNFLQEIGYDNLPEDQKERLLRSAKAELESRVGQEIGKGLKREQIEEFEALMESDQAVIKKLILGLDFDFREDKVFKALLKKRGLSEPTWATLGEYLSILWIQKNRPDYRDVVKKQTEILKQELKDRRSELSL